MSWHKVVVAPVVSCVNTHGVRCPVRGVPSGGRYAMTRVGPREPRRGAYDSLPDFVPCLPDTACWADAAAVPPVGPVTIYFGPPLPDWSYLARKAPPPAFRDYVDAAPDLTPLSVEYA